MTFSLIRELEQMNTFLTEMSIHIDSDKSDPKCVIDYQIRIKNTGHGVRSEHRPPHFHAVFYYDNEHWDISIEIDDVEPTFIINKNNPPLSRLSSTIKNKLLAYARNHHDSLLYTFEEGQLGKDTEASYKRIQFNRKVPAVSFTAKNHSVVITYADGFSLTIYFGNNGWPNHLKKMEDDYFFTNACHLSDDGFTIVWGNNYFEMNTYDDYYYCKEHKVDVVNLHLKKD